MCICWVCYLNKLQNARCNDKDNDDSLLLSIAQFPPNLYTGEAQYPSFDAGSPVVILVTEIIINLIFKK